MSVLGIAQLARRAVSIGRSAAAHADTGVPGVFTATLAISGLSDARREELVVALEEKLGVPRMPSVGDGKLRLKGWLAPGFSIQVGASSVIGEWSQILQQIGFAPSELLAGPVELTVEPALSPAPARLLITSKPAPRVAAAVGKLLGDRSARKLGRIHYGIGVAFADAYDHIAMTETGERSFAVALRVSELDPADADALAVEVARMFDAAPDRDEDGSVIMWAKTNKVGTPLGAVALIIRRLASFIDTLPAGATLELLGTELSQPSASDTVKRERVPAA